MRILAIDYGKSKVGLAVGDDVSNLPEPLMVLSPAELENQIIKIIGDHRINRLLIGLTGGKIDREINVFAQKLEKKTGLIVDFIDETLSTQEAQKLLISLGRKRKYRQRMEDAIAAAVMLKYYLENNCC